MVMNDRQHQSSKTSSIPTDVSRSEQFAFGKNWRRFIALLSDDRIADAEQSLKVMYDAPDFRSKSFLDIGSGSGLFSLAARRLGASVHSFDYDPESVACTEGLKIEFYPGDPQWTIEQGSVLDQAYIRSLGQFDFVYSWGVLHHTGEMWQALENAQMPLKPGGKLFIAIYNDQGWISKYWKLVKRIYNRNSAGRYCMIFLHAPYLIGLRFMVRLFTGRLKLERGMSLWHDMIDWLGGMPFETARPEEIHSFYRKRGFVLQEMRTSGGRSSCNEYVFKKLPA
jgi:2-polyprenyl-6-hydroxyphenyl methylase/3-demethylubiquinone-9 3-methyltransferase